VLSEEQKANWALLLMMEERENEPKIPVESVFEILK
jgi:hypothetical protein